MEGSMLGDAMALGCAACWAFAVLMFRVVPVGPVQLNLFKNGVASVLLILTTLSLGLSFAHDRSPTEWWLLLGSGVLGLAVADTVFLAGLRRIPASVAGVAECVYAPTVVLLAVVWLGEPLTVEGVIGTTLVAVGLAVVGYEPGIAQRERVDVAGLGLCAGAVMLTGLSVVMAKPVLDKSHLIETTTVRLLAGTLALLISEAVRGRLLASISLFKPQASWRYLLPATLLGTYVAMILWLGGMKYGSASRASLLNQSSAIFILLFARISGEGVPARRWIGAGIAMCGVMLIL